jgi:hypothetical protein
MPIENPAQVALDNRRRNVTDNTPQPEPATPPRIEVGTFGWSEHLADQRPAEFLHATSANIERWIKACVARIHTHQVRAEAVRVVKGCNAAVTAADSEFIDAGMACGVDFDKVRVSYDPPLDQISGNPLNYVLLDHNAYVARALGHGTIEAWLAKAKAREASQP